MPSLETILSKFWGYDSFRPLQREAMDCVLSHRDSVVVMPTGGGKSLCYQTPALVMSGMAVVVSPLISLMKDQVDALNGIGAPAAFLNSSQNEDERRAVISQIRAGNIKLLYVAPERLVMDGFLDFLKRCGVSFFAVDEAHCISSWGHDFRPEYRALRILRDTFSGIGVHAYTATATEPVRDDIAAQLGLRDPAVHIGDFDRPNLSYSARPQRQQLEQIGDVLRRHAGESGIIYCIRRVDVDKLAATLRQQGHNALPYHAGLEDDVRRTNQEKFLRDEADIIVSTVAFGMGIDKPDVRYVVHWGMPKSLEHYQQESGRAGRDGLESECNLFYSGGDIMTWKHFLRDLEPDAQEVQRRKLEAMYAFCRSTTCRHRTLVTYFGQEYGGDNCGACDVCLDHLEYIQDPLPVAQKILSCVVRVGESFGTTYVVRVLSGSRDKRILDNGHERLSTFGLLAEHGRTAIRDWVEQLVWQGALEMRGDYAVLGVTPKGRLVLRGTECPKLTKPVPRRERREKTAAGAAGSWEGVDRALFEKLRSLRRDIAGERGVPPFIIFDDAALRDMARRKPTSPSAFLQVRGVGEKKAREFSDAFLSEIRRHLNS